MTVMNIARMLSVMLKELESRDHTCGEALFIRSITSSLSMSSTKLLSRMKFCRKISHLWGMIPSSSLMVYWAMKFFSLMASSTNCGVKKHTKKVMMEAMANKTMMMDTLLLPTRNFFCTKYTSG